MAYITRSDFKAFVPHFDSTADDTLLDAILLAAEGAINWRCGRRFDAATQATARQFYPAHSGWVRVDDISTTASLVVAYDSSDDGTADVTLTTAQYQLEPVNGVGADGTAGWPYTAIRAVDASFPTTTVRAPVHVTALWGWASTPDLVKQATKVLANEMYKHREAPLGVTEFGEFGIMRVRENPVVASLLKPFMRAEKRSIGVGGAR
jgi:hypothetical protein